MTKSERQQSLEQARKACSILAEPLRADGNHIVIRPAFRPLLLALIEEFTRLDLSSRRPTAGRPPLPNPSPRTLSQRRYRAKRKLS